MIFDIRHKTTFDYEAVVSISHHKFHLMPRAHALQRRIQMSTECVPAPATQATTEDYFANPVEFVTIQQPHKRFVVTAQSRIEVFENRPNIDPNLSPSWETVADALATDARGNLEAYQFIFDSPFVSSSQQAADYALASFTPNRPILDAAADLTHRIFTEFEYEGGVSDVSTPVADVFAMRKGVCQDFAHLALSCLRSLGLAARYISGYLLTHPPEGQEKLVGADASHAWFSVWAGDSGWVDFDPTNDVIPSNEHITVAWGRDYADVSPINGFILGGGAHEIKVAVDVVPHQANAT